MDGSEGILWFLGDLADPWVEAIVASAPASWTVERTQCTDSLPDRTFLADCLPDLIVLHRNRLTTVDAERIQRWRDVAIRRDLTRSSTFRFPGAVDALDTSWRSPEAPPTPPFQGGATDGPAPKSLFSKDLRAGRSLQEGATDGPAFEPLFSQDSKAGRSPQGGATDGSAGEPLSSMHSKSGSALSTGVGVAPRIVVCASPYLRYEELERSSSLIDDVISDAVAAEVLPLRLARHFRPQRARKGVADQSLRIDVASGDEELSEMLVDACARAGYRVRAIDDRWGRPLGPSKPGRADERVLTIWDAPVLEPDWAERLGMYRRVSGAVIALAGFVDRTIVTTAKSHGALACLDLPCEIDDLLDLIERFANGSHPVPGVRFDQAHQVPPAVRRRENTGPAHRNVDAPAWSESARSSTISKSF